MTVDWRVIYTDSMDAYHRYGPALRRKCERMLRSQQDAEDIVQSLFADLIQQGKMNVDLPYLYRAVTNRCLNHIRNNKRHQQILRSHREDSLGADVMGQDERAVKMDLLFRLLDRLDRKSAEILAYHYLDDLTQEEIGAILGMSRRSVNKRLMRARSKLEALRNAGDLT